MLDRIPQNIGKYVTYQFVGHYPTNTIRGKINVNISIGDM